LRDDYAGGMKDLGGSGNHKLALPRIERGATEEKAIREKGGLDCTADKTKLRGAGGKRWYIRKEKGILGQ